MNDTSILKLSLFKGYGIELEYMIVDRDTLNILPIADKVMHAVSGTYEDEVERGEIHWSNELALHVIEFKTAGPVNSLTGLEATFQEHIAEVNEILKSFNGMLMPTAMHPWMDPYKEMHLWPHAHNPIYESYHRIFDCRGHGWSNLQSAHINLPFSNDAEFAKLHAAIRVLLPVMPAIAASSPLVDRKLSGFLDTRLDVYRHNAKAIPSIAGKVIPEVSISQQDYVDHILKPMYRDIAPLDHDKILQHEWLNSRGAIARFDRFTIEIRVLDIQECPNADLAIAQIVTSALKALVAERWATIDQMNKLELNSLHSIFLESIKNGEEALITNQEYLSLFGIEDACTAKDLWKYLRSSVEVPLKASSSLDFILENGPLARRIKKAWQKDPSQEHLKKIYKRLCQCLETGTMFE